MISRIVAFLAFARLARTLGPQNYGLVEYVVGLAMLFGAAVETGLGTVGIRRIALRPEQLPAVAAQIPTARFVMALVSVPVMLLIARPPTHGTGAQGLVWLYALSLLVAPWRQDWLLQATERMTEAAVAQILRTTVFAFVVITLVASPDDLLWVGWAEVAAVSAMSLFCFAVQHARITPWRFHASITGLPDLATEGGLIGLGSIAWSANQYAPLLLMAYFAGGEETAWFAAANRVMGSLLAFSNLYYFNLYPAIARATAADQDELAAILAASYRVLAWSGTLAALCLTLLAEPLATLAFGAQFSHAASVLAIMAWALPVALLSGHARWSLVAAGAQARVVSAQLVGSIAVVAVGVPAILLLGGRGAALAAIAAPLAVWLVSHAFASRVGVRLPLFRLGFRPALLALIAVAAVKALHLTSWSAAAGVALFAGAAPFVDRQLLRDLLRLGEIRRSAPVQSTGAV